MGMGVRLALLIATTVAVAGIASGAGGTNGAAELTFYPQAGILWQDLYLANFVDLDPGPGVRDYACGTQTYDGHTGTDTNIRSFREMDIGVPVFAARDGRVLSVRDGAYDRNFGPRTAKFDNHVVLQHGPGRMTIYGHLRRGIKLKQRQRVVAGQQLGWTASSGNSSGPHLHFTSQVAGKIVEPFAGACREGASGWTDQVEMPTEPYLRDLALSAKPFVKKADVPHDRAKRTGTFVTGTRMVYVRVELGMFARGTPIRIRILRPDGSAAVDQTPAVGFRFPNGLGRASAGYRVALRPIGSWRVVVDAGGRTLAEAPFAVVAKRRDVRNRPPNPVIAELIPPTPSARGVAQCRVETSLITEDPDYDIVRYTYRWFVGGRLVRELTSAALSDVLRKGVAVSGRELSCVVVPSDGRLFGARATASTTTR